jgi:hypothetical protein
MQGFLLPIAIIALAAWTAVLGAIQLARRPRIGQNVASQRHWDEQSPAIVALLCSRRGEVPDCALTATFLDLIARGFLKRSAARSGHARIEIADGDRSALKSYERQLLDHVEVRARLGGGTVLEEALRLESSEHAKRWMAEFTEKVIAEARERKLSEGRASLWALFWLWLTLLVAVVLLAIASIGTVVGVIVFFVLAQPVRTLLRERSTEAGSQLVPMYQALAAQHENRPARNDRKAAYVAALGTGGERTLFAHHDGREVWSNQSGQWRKVRIIDPPLLFHGTDPVAALYVTPGALVFFGIWTWLLYGFTVHPGRWSIPAIVLAAGWVILVLGNFLVWRFVYRGLYHLRHGTVGVEGQVIYLDARDAGGDEPATSYHVAIDDGRSTRVALHEIDRNLFDQLRYGDRLRLDVTPKLRCVRSTRVVSAPI